MDTGEMSIEERILMTRMYPSKLDLIWIYLDTVTSGPHSAWRMI
jgi:hypothetical protein